MKKVPVTYVYFKTTSLKRSESPACHIVGTTLFVHSEVLTSKSKTAGGFLQLTPSPARQYGAREDPDDVFAKGQEGRYRVAKACGGPDSVDKLNFPTQQKACKYGFGFVSQRKDVGRLNHHFCQEGLVQSSCFC